MQSSETKQGFSDIINLIAKLGQVAVITTGFLAKMFRQTSEGLAAATGGGVYAYSEATIQEKIDNFERLKADLKGATPALKAQWDKELAVLRGRLQQIKAQQIADSVNMPPEARAAAAKGNFNTSGDAEAEAKRAAAAAAAEAKRATAARIAEEKRAAEEIRKINEAEEQDRIERDKRISEGLAEVRIDLLRQSGQAAEAAFAEIDAKYAQLLADLRAKGDSEGEATLRKLIGLEKADAELKAFDEQVRAVMDNLREQTAFINNAREVPGGITSLQAEEQMRALRAQSIQQLTVLREKAMAAYNAAPTAETLARVNQLDGAIKELDDSFTTLLAKTAEDEGVQALSGFFTDLALEAKSFKDAFKDMVRNFVSGIAQMVAQQLALNAVKGITRAFGSFHTGGVAGQAGGSRRVVDPAVFAAAPRYHGGGVAGLRANEVPAILLKGERVLSPSQTREYDRGSRPSPGVRIVNVFDPNFVPDQMDSAAGEKVILNAIARNPGRINQMLG
jgi:hypothetical protein